MKFNQLMDNISFETFFDIVSASPRKVREALFSRYGIKNKTKFSLVTSKEKKAQKIRLLRDKLKFAESPKEQEFLKELTRNWLFLKRPLLKATLDYLGIENDNGLVEVETDFFQKLNKSQVDDLINHLSPNFSKDSILVYFTFMEVPYTADKLIGKN